MLDEKTDSLPLFVHGFDPFRVWVLKNKIITLDKYAQCHISRLTAFSFLCELYRNKNSKKGIPKEFHTHLEASISKELVDTNFPCIMGVIDLEGRTQCLAMKMKIVVGESTNIVRLFDVVVIDCVRGILSNEFTYIDLDIELLLPAEEAFFLFANICSSLATLKLSYINERESFDQPYLQGKVTKRYKKDSSNKTAIQSEGRYLTDSFSILYFQYLLKKFAKKTISPATILRLSGAGVLVYLTDSPTVQSFFQDIFYELQNNFSTLTRNQKIQYYTLLAIGHKWSEHIKTEIRSFYETNSHIINALKRELTTNFPDIRTLTSSTIPQKQFYKEYKSTYWSKQTR